jgi:hypothetical protein
VTTPLVVSDVSAVASVLVMAACERRWTYVPLAWPVPAWLLSHDDDGGDSDLPAMVFAVLQQVLAVGAIGTSRVRSGSVR